MYKALGVKITNINNDQAESKCPFHDDSNDSFSFNVESGLWKCFGNDDCGAGNVQQFISKSFGVVKTDADDVIKCIVEPIKEKPSTYHKNLLKNKKLLDALKTKRGFNDAIIKKYKIGHDGERYTFPIYVGGVLMNIRKYSLTGKGTKMINVSGYGSAKLYPFDNIQKKEIYLFEGETDCLLANQLGINAMTATTGAGVFNSAWNSLFTGKRVNICYDIDEAGKKGAEKIAKSISKFCDDVYIVGLPSAGMPKNGDFTDYIVNLGHTVADFKKIVKGAVKYGSADEPEKEKDDKIYDTNLKNSSNKEFYFKKIRLPIIVSGKDLTPYIIPKVVRGRCSRMSPADDKKCIGCELANGRAKTITVDESDDLILKMVSASDTQVKGYLKQALGISHICNQYEIEIRETQNVESIRVIPEIDYSSRDAEYETRTCFYINDTGKRIKTNASYVIEGVSVPNPKNQYATINVYKATPKQTELDVFSMSPDIKKQLKIFKPKKNQTVADKFDEIHNDLTYNVSKIYKRNDLLTAIDLIYYSALEFDLLGERLPKGYVEGLIIGDTRCGKTRTIQTIVDHYRAGEFITGENTSYAGLVGGMSQIGNQWTINWGKLPLNDRRLVIVDEASSLTHETIANLSAIRSSGVAEIVKIQTEKTHARCRMVWVSNPRSGYRLNTYNHGVQAIKELIGKSEDIARFDFSTTVATDDVDLTDIQKESRRRVKHVYTSDLCNLLLLWVWSRTKQNIKIDRDTETAIVTFANELGRKYSPSIPLVEPAEMRIKVARLAVAVACRLFSTDDGENVIVKPEHVNFVYKYLDGIYSKASMSYDLYSQNEFRKTIMSVENRDRLIAEFKRKFPNWDIVRNVLMENQVFRKREFETQVGFDKDLASEFFKWTTINRLVKSTSGGYVKNPTFTELLKFIIDDVNEYQEPTGGKL